jgi:3-methyladenine DNA glycosylase/8-oxoguanine DNA glycosylase
MTDGATVAPAVPTPRRGRLPTDEPSDAVVRVPAPYDLGATLVVLRHGPRDPAYVTARDDTVWRACRLTDGSTATLRMRAGATVAGQDEVVVHARAWGEGAARLLAGLPELIGATDDPSGLSALVAGHPVLADSARRNRGLRVIRSGAVLESLVPAVLEQKVTVIEAHEAYRRLLRRFGTPAPGPAAGDADGPPVPLFCPPTPACWARIPSWEWHRAGVEGKRAATVIAACRVAAALERTVDLPHAEAERRLRTVPGIGVWTAAEVRQRAHGDPDAVSVGDFHLSHAVGYALAGERNADDDRMLELLAPYAGSRYRVTRLVVASGVRQPRRGPRMAPRDFRAY